MERYGYASTLILSTEIILDASVAVVSEAPYSRSAILWVICCPPEVVEGKRTWNGRQNRKG